MANEQTTNVSASKKIATVSLAFLGAIIGIICLILLKKNTHIFTIFLSLYFSIYAIIVIVYLYKKTNVNNPEFNMIINISMYSLCLLICIIGYTIFLMNYKNSKY